LNSIVVIIQVSRGVFSSFLPMELDLTGSLDDTDVSSSSNAPQEAKIPIYFADGSKCPIALSRKACQMSVFFQGILEDPNCTEIRLQNAQVVPRIGTEVFRWMEYHENVPVVLPKKPLSSTNLADLIPEWDAKFASREDQDDVFLILMVANYFQVTALVELMAAQVATKLKGRTPDEIKKTFHIDHDITPEEEVQLRREFPDMFEDIPVKP